MRVHAHAVLSRIPRRFSLTAFFVLVAIIALFMAWRRNVALESLMARLVPEALEEEKLFVQRVPDAFLTSDSSPPDFSLPDPFKRRQVLVDYFESLDSTRFRLGVYTYDKFRSDVKSATSQVRPSGLDLDDVDPAEAFVLWLGGVPVSHHPPRVGGWSFVEPNPLNAPLSRRNFRPGWFAPERLTDHDYDGWFEYVPRLSRRHALPAPYAYFSRRSSTGDQSADSQCYPCPHVANHKSLIAAWGVAQPYSEFWECYYRGRLNKTGENCIVTAGLDGRYGPPADTRVRGWYSLSSEDEDNEDTYGRDHEVVTFGYPAAIRDTVTAGRGPNLDKLRRGCPPSFVIDRRTGRVSRREP